MRPIDKLDAKLFMMSRLSSQLTQYKMAQTKLREAIESACRHAGVTWDARSQSTEELIVTAELLLKDLRKEYLRYGRDQSRLKEAATPGSSRSRGASRKR